MRHRDDHIAQHSLLVSIIPADLIQRILQLKNKEQNIFKLIAEVFIGLPGGVGLFLHIDQQLNILQREDSFCYGDKNQISDLLPVMLIMELVMVILGSGYRYSVMYLAACSR